jgi:predicted membrane protein (TIGR00267 family)
LVLLPSDFITAATISVIITMIFLFFLGVWMGRIAKTNMLFGGLRMVIVGLITALICVLIGAH